MLRKENFTPGEYYHVYNRTLFNNPVFDDQKNCERLLQALLLANSTKAGLAFQFLRNHKDATVDNALEIISDGKKLVDVVCYAVMPDHYHLLLREKEEGGISSFLHRCNISIAKYVNTKTNRRGPLFESLFQSKHITDNEYLLHLSLYIHLNPLDFLEGKSWRKHGLKNWTQAKKKLLNYPYSSLKSFLQKENSDKIISGIEIIKEQFKNESEYESFLCSWSDENLEKINDLL